MSNARMKEEKANSPCPRSFEKGMRKNVNCIPRARVEVVGGNRVHLRPVGGETPRPASGRAGRCVRRGRHAAIEFHEFALIFDKITHGEYGTRKTNRKQSRTAERKAPERAASAVCGPGHGRRY